MEKTTGDLYENAQRHWRDITGCDLTSADADCKALYKLINAPKRSIPLWDVDKGEPDLDGFLPHSAWMTRAARQYKLDTTGFGLPPSKTVDLNVFDVSLFSVLRR